MKENGHCLSKRLTTLRGIREAVVGLDEPTPFELGFVARQIGMPPFNPFIPTNQLEELPQSYFQFDFGYWYAGVEAEEGVCGSR